MKQDAIRCELVSWTTVQKLAYEVALQIKSAGFKPDLMIAIARGGFVPARLLCDFLHIYELVSIRVEHYTQGGQKKPVARLKYPLSVDIRGKRVLIVDDVCDSGDTYRVALEHVREFSPAEVKTASLQHKAGASFEPDFIAGHIQEWRWLIYPWAVTEDVGGLIKQMPDAPATLVELRERLHEEHGVQLTEARLSEILRFGNL